MDTLTHYEYRRMRRSQKLFGSDLRVTQIPQNILKIPSNLAHGLRMISSPTDF